MSKRFPASRRWDQLWQLAGCVLRRLWTGVSSGTSLSLGSLPCRSPGWSVPPSWRSLPSSSCEPRDQTPPSLSHFVFTIFKLCVHFKSRLLVTKCYCWMSIMCWTQYHFSWLLYNVLNDLLFLSNHYCSDTCTQIVCYILWICYNTFVIETWF